MSTSTGIITQGLMEDIAKGTLPWRKSWRTFAFCPQNAVSHQSYNGINRLILSLAAAKHGYKMPYYLTYNQAADVPEGGGFVKAGENLHQLYSGNS